MILSKADEPSVKTAMSEQISSRSTSGRASQHPNAVRSPFLFEFRAFDSEKFATRGIVNENGPISQSIPATTR